MTALVLQTKISQTSSHTKVYTTLVTQYGDGYIQRAIDGINVEKETWNVVYENLNVTEYRTLLTFLDTVKMSGVIEWAPIDDVGSPVPTKKWIVDPESEVSIVNKTGDIYDVSIVLKRVYDL